MENIRAKIGEIALHLGKPWKFNGLPPLSDWCFDIIDGCGRGFFIRLNKDKLHISGKFPRDKTRIYRRSCPSIGVSAKRPAKDIAADIRRRLLPDYLEAYTEAAQTYANEKALEEQKALIRQAIVKVSRGYTVGHSESVYFDKGEARIDYGETVKLTLRDLPPDLAIRIIGMVKQNEKEEI